MSLSKALSLIRRLGPDEAGTYCDRFSAITYNIYKSINDSLPQLENLGIDKGLISKLRKQKELLERNYHRFVHAQAKGYIPTAEKMPSNQKPL